LTSTGDRNLAIVIETKEGQKSELRDFVLPEKLTVATIEGIVVWPDGRAVKRGNVMAHDVEFPDSNVGSIEFGSDGRFALQLFMGRRYKGYAITSNDHEGHESLWFFETAHGEMIFDSPAERLTLRMSEKP
jgi:hypothetical protein